MKDVLFASPFVPREWIAAHGLRPRRFPANLPDDARPPCASMGLCPFAGAFLETANAAKSGAVVFATTCDQMRRAADDAASQTGAEVFLMNIPAVWQAPASRQFYRAELDRLGAFLVRIGGSAPSPAILAAEMRRHNYLRGALLAHRTRLSGRQCAQALARYWMDGSMVVPTQDADRTRNAIPLAIVGESLLPSHFVLLDWIEALGGSVALDATSGGERSLLPAFEQSRIEHDPIAALADGYFAGMTDAFQRPNTRLYDWLRPRVSERGIRGIVLWHYSWCDLWRAEANRLRDEFQLPVLHLDAADAALPGPSMKNRLEVFFEILRP